MEPFITALFKGRVKIRDFDPLRFFDAFVEQIVQLLDAFNATHTDHQLPVESSQQIARPSSAHKQLLTRLANGETMQGTAAFNP